jgi:ribosomal protein L16/L10AE
MKTPQRLKYRKYFKYKIDKRKKVLLTKDKLEDGVGFLQIVNQGKLFASNIESCRVSIRRMSKRKKRK